MKVDLFDYALPEALIAQRPAERRDASRLLVFDRASGRTEDRLFSDLPEYLRAGDVLVLNDSRVLKARLLGEKAGTGGRVEVFLLREEGGVWECLARPARRLRVGDRILFAEDARQALADGRAVGLAAEVLAKGEGGVVTVRFEDGAGKPLDAGGVYAAVERVGHMPLPPYIKRADEDADAQRYQTVYAREPGSAAAQTAGLHFTEELLARIRAAGVHIAAVTLHVGLGTFRPVQSEDVEGHTMHTEVYHIPQETADAIGAAKTCGRRVVCVGTTSVRTVESAFVDGAVKAGYGETDIFLYPGGPSGFRVTDALVTNFHLPKSTLLMLVAAFAGRERILRVYEEAVAKGYRFFSYGDAMLLL
ncbi:MAG: tRNA preQ1(34) S-adenosylmethionine ribosyltransferase-isomerase QueA [Clostridiales Family XIII bacterium]|nr:tRNA preQ1(34) S-adenosylmethionine ribosyltransferase-isomerase QueA [Clostridiales Family XIII bacterium]